MALTAGSVSVASDGTVTKTDMAEAIYDSFVANMPAEQFSSVEAKTIWANMSTAIAEALSAYIPANAEVTITTSTGSLQTSTGSGNPTDPPATTQVLSVT